MMQPNKQHPRCLAALAAAAALGGAGQAASAQDNVFKAAVTRYDTHSRTTGISGIGVPPGADAKVGDATTLLLTYERALSPAFGLEFVLGIPPKIKARATGSVAFLGEVLTARNVAPTVFLNYHFRDPGDALRPYVGLGVNYTRFTKVKSKLASDVKLEDSIGPAAQIGADYLISPHWGVFASVAVADVKSRLVASGSTVLTTTVDFRPIVYTAGVSYRF